MKKILFGVVLGIIGVFAYQTTTKRDVDNFVNKVDRASKEFRK